MKKTILSVLVLASLSLISTKSQADEIEYSCDGTYDSKQAADVLDPSTISVKAHLDAVMLGDESSSGEYTMLKAKLVLTATNLNGADAGSFDLQGDLIGKVNSAHSKKYADYIRFHLGSNLGKAYQDNGNAPQTFLLVPANDSKIVYIQRSNSGHDVYPTITLKCE
ncbi:MAG: hypothetical protein ACXVLQ_06955 [Bacteriovorax sp.]